VAKIGAKVPSTKLFAETEKRRKTRVKVDAYRDSGMSWGSNESSKKGEEKYNDSFH
jgi:hypothetical protein